MRISRHQIAAFAAVGREKSFSGAAASLSLGQSAVTQHISGLEKAIGTRLFNRTRSGAILTEAGQQLFALADRIRVLEDLFHERISEYADLDVGSLSVCVSTPRPALGVIAAFQNAFPGVKVDLRVAPWREAVQIVRSREADIGIVAEPETRDGLHCIDIERQPFVAIVPRDHHFADREHVSIREIGAETIVRLTPSSYTRNQVDRMFASAGQHPENTLTTSGYEMALEAALHGLGVFVGLDGAQAPYQDAKSIPIIEFPEEHAYTVICNEDKSSLRSIRAFFAIAEKGIRPGHSWHLDDASN